MYNRYTSHCKEFCRAEPKHEPYRNDNCGGGCDPPLPPPIPPRHAHSGAPGAKNPFSSILGLLPKDLDFGDIMLYAVLFLLFLKNGDEECLIILAVLIFMK